MVIKELDAVVLTSDLSQHGLKAGDVGAVVMVYRGGEAYEVEFVTMKGHTISVITLPRDSIRPVEATDLIHVRRAAVA